MPGPQALCNTPYQPFALFCYFYLPSYTSFIPVSDSEFSSPSPFLPLPPPLCYTMSAKKRLGTYVQHHSSCPDQQLPPFQSPTCSFSSTKCPLCLGQHFRSFHLSGFIVHQFLREPLHLHLTTLNLLLVTIPPTQAYFALSYSSSTGTSLLTACEMVSPLVPLPNYFFL